MTEAEIQSLTDEELANIINSYGEFPYNTDEWQLFTLARIEGRIRSEQAESQRKARGEQPLFTE